MSTNNCRTEQKGNGRLLARIDERHCVYLAENNAVHLVWGQDMLFYCPGDFPGLVYSLYSLKMRCDKRCRRGERCEWEDDSGLVYLQYGSLHLPLTPEECYQMQTLVQEAAGRLAKLRKTGDLLPQKRRDTFLAYMDESHRVYLCEFDLIHLEWGRDTLIFCPDDFARLPQLLAGQMNECEMHLDRT
jgi:hypothetical protein